MIHQIDAAGQSIGRVASRTATLLMGKNSPSFAKNKVGADSVVIANASRLKIAEEKQVQKKYDRYSGYPGGRKEKNLEQIAAAKGYGEVLRRAIKGMLPRNRLVVARMKKLKITE